MDRRFFSVRSDTVTTPSGGAGIYDWVDAPDIVRVAAITPDGMIYVVEQHHYLPNRPGMWQLPGGAVDRGEDIAEAAARELSEEVGVGAGVLVHVVSVWPMPGLSAARVHLFVARDLKAGQPNPEPSEAGLLAKAVPWARAVQAAMDGQMGCAPSAQLVLALALNGLPSSSNDGLTAIRGV